MMVLRRSERANRAQEGKLRNRTRGGERGEAKRRGGDRWRGRQKWNREMEEDKKVRGGESPAAIKWKHRIKGKPGARRAT